MMILGILGIYMPIFSTQLRGVSCGRFPLRGCARCRLFEHAVNLFKRQTLRFRHKEVRIDEGTCAETAPHEEDVGLQIALVLIDHIRRDDGDDGIPQPVGSSRKTNTASTDGNREDFTNDDPCTGTPGGSEEENVDTNEGDLGADGRDIIGNRFTVCYVRMIETDGVANDRDDELADKHTECTPDEERATTESLNRPEGYWSRQNIDECKDEGD